MSELPFVAMFRAVCLSACFAVTFAQTSGSTIANGDGTRNPIDVLPTVVSSTVRVL